MLTLTTLRRLWPSGNSKVPGLLEGIAAAAPSVFPKYGLTTIVSVAQAMAQFSHECGAGLEVTENINYSAERACQVWPNRFSSPADCYAKCDSFSGDPQFHIKLIDHVYGGRMGNAPYPSHDGSTYIGRGLSQVTGKEGYQKLATMTGIDVIAHPEYLSDPKYVLLLGVADFILCGCLPYAVNGDTLNVTKHLNGGTVGLAEREAWYAKWKPALEQEKPEAPPVIVQPPAPPVQPVPVPPPAPSIHPKHALGGAAIIAAIITALQSPKVEIGLAIIAVAIVFAVVLHFIWKR